MTETNDKDLQAELVAMQTIVDALEPLDKETVYRILAWARDRFEKRQKAEPERR